MPMLPPIPYKAPLLDRAGLVTRPWQQWFERLLQRVGGTGDVPANDELEASVLSDPVSEPLVLVHRVERQLKDLETTVVFEGGTKAELHALRQELHDLETLAVFGD